jgi:cation-transporting ATPase 13A1
MFFFFLSRTRPAKKLSAQRPPSGVFCWRVMVSMIGQFMIHLFFLFKSLQVTQPFIDHADPSMHPDGKFRPNVINTVMFLVSCIMQVTTFVANYKGQPFMEKLTENKLLFQSVVVSYSFLFMAVFEILPFLNETLELVPFPTKEVLIYIELEDIQYAYYKTYWVSTCTLCSLQDKCV